MRTALGLQPIGRFAAAVGVVAVLCSGCSSSGPAGGDTVPLTTVDAAQGTVPPPQDAETPAPSSTAAPSTTTILSSTTTEPEPQEAAEEAADEGLTKDDAAALLAQYGVEECFLTSLGPCDLDWWEHGPPGCVLASTGSVNCDGVMFCFNDGWAPCRPSDDPAPPTAAIVCPAGWVPVPLSYPDRAWEGCWPECDELERCQPPTEPPKIVYESARRSLSDALGVAPEQLTLIHSDTARWSSGALGCPQEGYGYTAAVEDGWRFRFEYDSLPYFVHVSTTFGNLNGLVVVDRWGGWQTLDGNPCLAYSSGIHYEERADAKALLDTYGVVECFVNAMGPCYLRWLEYGPGPECALMSSGDVECNGVWFCWEAGSGWVPCAE